MPGSGACPVLMLSRYWCSSRTNLHSYSTGAHTVLSQYWYLSLTECLLVQCLYWCSSSTDALADCHSSCIKVQLVQCLILVLIQFESGCSYSSGVHPVSTLLRRWCSTCTELLLVLTRQSPRPNARSGCMLRATRAEYRRERPLPWRPLLPPSATGPWYWPVAGD